MWVLVLLAHVGMIGIAYRQSDDVNEGRLVLKLVGYLLLGLFTIIVAATPLPVGFMIYLMFYSKDCPNARAKFMAVLFGLLGFVINVLFVW